MKVLALTVNDKTLIRCALTATGVDLKPDRRAIKGVAGIAYYHDGEVLLSKRPISPGINIPLIPAKATTNNLLVAIEEAMLGQFKLEDIQPFRFRNYVGIVGGFLEGTRGLRDNILDNLPRYMANNIKGTTWNELVFHLFLSYLHDVNKIDDAEIPHRIFIESTVSMLKILPKFLNKRMLGTNEKIFMILSNGNSTIGFSTADGTILLRRIREIKHCPVCSSPETGPVDHTNIQAAAMLISPGTGRIPGFSPLKSYEMVLVGSNGQAFIKDLLPLIR